MQSIISLCCIQICRSVFLVQQKKEKKNDIFYSLYWHSCRIHFFFLTHFHILLWFTITFWMRYFERRIDILKNVTLNSAWIHTYIVSIQPLKFNISMHIKWNRLVFSNFYYFFGNVCLCFFCTKDMVSFSFLSTITYKQQRCQ